jgi:hypothetical protein
MQRFIKRKIFSMFMHAYINKIIQQQCLQILVRKILFNVSNTCMHKKPHISSIS